jgi:RHS repeat-associated protein
LGRVTGKGQTIGTVTQSVGYAYTNGDLVSLITPSGQTVTYGYTNHRITSVTVNGTTILSGATYDPFGPANAWTWGNATTTSRVFDADGNPSQFITASVTNGYTIDNASRITGISDSSLASNSWTFGYDLLDRVNSGASTAITEGYTYDANSNRLTTTGSVPSAETIATSSNQLSSTSGSLARTYSYDAAGNTLGYASNSYTFNQRGRMSQATVVGAATSYLYNALGQLIQKSGNGGTTLLMYDEAGHILGEYTGTGALIQETIWMGDTPVVTLQPNGSSIAIYYVHTDHLGTPRKITRPSDNGLMWRWDPDTFGSITPNTNPLGLGTFNYNLRFPGQYSLNESGLYYNYYRTYDPQTGRYIESDPIGLRGGINPYAHANGNPISEYDPLGLWAMGDPINQGVANAITGFRDGVSRILTFGLTSTSAVRAEWGIDGGIDVCSASYKGGKYTGYAWGAATMWAGGLNGGANSMFWSGGPVAQNFAYYAGTTLDRTIIGGFVNSLPFVPQPVWNVLSATFAMNATEPAAAIILGEGPGWALEARILAWRGISVIR